MTPDLPTAHRTLGQALRDTATRWPERDALLSEARCLTWAQLDAEVDQLAGLLHSLGVKKGDVVGGVITKRPEVVTTFLACARIGALYAPVNFKLHMDRVRFQFESADIRCVVTEASFDKVLKPLMRFLSDPAKVIYVGELGRHGTTQYSQLGAHSDPGVSTSPEEPCYLNYTSGTTGEPKGALTSHFNILYQALTAFDGDTGLTPEGFEGMGFSTPDVFLGMFSVFAHPHELFHRSLVCGGAFVIVDSLNPRIIARAIQRFSVTWMMAVPSFYEMLLDHMHAGGEKLSSLRVLESGGAFVSAETLRKMEEAFGASFMPVWGSTETTGVAVAMRPDRPRKPGTTGTPISGYEVKVVDSHGRDCKPGETGEMLVRGPAVISKYLNNPEETVALFVGGWYHTRDLVTRGEEGFIQFVGRRSDMLKIGGIRVYPLEIERVIKDHPQVRDVVVVRAEERVRGEIARAVISTVPGSDLTVRSVQSYCRDRLAVYKVPRIVEFWEEVPKLPNGKLNRRAVVDVAVDASRDDRG